MEYLKENAPALFCLVRYWLGPMIDALLAVLGVGLVYCYFRPDSATWAGEFCGRWYGISVLIYTAGLIWFYPMQESENN